MAHLDWLAHARILEAGHASDWISGFIGAGGAICGSLAAVFWTERFNLRWRKREERQKTTIGTFSAFQKLNHIYSSLYQIDDHLGESFSRAQQTGIQYKCQVTVPILRLSTPVAFSTDELWALTKAGGTDLLNRASSLDHAYNAVIETMARYDSDRGGVLALMPADKITDDMGSSALTEEQLLKVLPGLIQLDSLLTQTRPIVTSLVADTFDAIKLLVYARERPLGRKFSVELPDPSGTIVTLSAQDAPRERRWFELWSA